MTGKYEWSLGDVTFADRRGSKDWNEEDHPRDADGRFGSGGGSEADATAARKADYDAGLALQVSVLNDGRSINPGFPLAEAIMARTGGGDYGMEQHELLVEAIQHAEPDAPVLYRGIAMNEEYNGWDPAMTAQFTAGLVPGAELEMRLGSWTKDPDIVHQFVGTDAYLRPTSGAGTDSVGTEFTTSMAEGAGFYVTPTGTVIQPEDERVVIALEPGAQALNMQPNAHPDWEYQAEWATAGTFRVESVAHDGVVWKVQVSQINTDEPQDVSNMTFHQAMTALGETP